jgi:hypothetical protein
VTDSTNIQNFTSNRERLLGMYCSILVFPFVPTRDSSTDNSRRGLSLNLANKLLWERIYLTGTLRKNRHMPQMIKNARPQAGDAVYARQEQNMLCCFRDPPACGRAFFIICGICLFFLKVPVKYIRSHNSLLAKFNEEKKLSAKT